MRFDAVVARAFGPISGQTLAVAPGLTILSGDRAIGAAWIAALAHGLTGTEAPTPGLADDAPPDGDRNVVTDISLADDRRYRLERDGDQCRILDLTSGRDIAPRVPEQDGARLIGLERASFVATAIRRGARLIDQPETIATLLQPPDPDAARAALVAAQAGLADAEALAQQRQIAKNRADIFKMLAARSRRQQFLVRVKEAQRVAAEAEATADLASLGPVTEALADWDALPTAAYTLEPGDLVPDPQVLAAREALVAAQNDRDALAARRPPEPPRSDPTDLPPETLREIAQTLATPVPSLADIPDPVPAGTGCAIGLTLTFVGIAALLVGVMVVLLFPRAVTIDLTPLIPVVTAPPWAIALTGFVPGVLLLAAGLVGIAAALARVGERESAESVAARAALEKRERARLRAKTLGLPDDPAALNALADRLEGAAGDAEPYRRWLEEDRAVAKQIARATEALREALLARDVTPDDDVVASAESYVRACLRRRAQAEQPADTDRAALETRLRGMAVARGIPDADGAIDDVVEALRRWTPRTTADPNAVALRAEADRLAVGVTEAELASVVLEVDAAAQIARLGLAAEVALRSWTTAAQRLAALPDGPTVAEAKRAVAVAEHRLAASASDSSATFATNATRWLTRLTGDPEARLHWSADGPALTLGTDGASATPIALADPCLADLADIAVRIALVESLAPPDEPCPLLLESPFGPCADERLGVALEALAQAATTRQVVVADPSDTVAAWADFRLDPSRDRLVSLAASA